MRCFVWVCLFTTTLFGSNLVSEEYDFVGKHFIASYKDCNPEALTNLTKLKETLTLAATRSGAHILDSIDYTFEPNALTMVILLSESHASIHTYPEYNACFVDLFTCGNKCSNSAFDEVLRAYLQPKKVDSQILERE